MVRRYADTDDTMAEDAIGLEVDSLFYTCWNCQHLVSRESVHACDTDNSDGPLCDYCGNPLSAGEVNYCSALCAHHAELDNREDR